MNMESILMVARWEGCVGGMGEEVRELRNANRYHIFQTIRCTGP